MPLPSSAAKPLELLLSSQCACYRPECRHRTSIKLVTVTVPVTSSTIGTQLRRRKGMRCSSSMSMSASQLSRMPARWPAPTTATTLGALSAQQPVPMSLHAAQTASRQVEATHMELMCDQGLGCALDAEFAAAC